MSTTETNIILVACVICERTPGRMPILNMNQSYPVRILTNIVTPAGFKPQSVQAYLCQQHYDAQGKSSETPSSDEGVNISY